MNNGNPNRRQVLKAGAAIAAAAAAGFSAVDAIAQDGVSGGTTADLAGAEIKLPEPDRKGTMTLCEALAARRSKRSFDPDIPVALTDISTILWSAQGITEDKRKFRAAPSAGALFPMDLFLMAQNGVFKYVPLQHSLVRTAEGNRKERLIDASLGQKCLSSAPCLLVITSEYERCSVKYGERAERYCKIEAGLIAENVSLQVAALGLGTVIVGAFYDDKVAEALSIEPKYRPLLLMPVGKSK